MSFTLVLRACALILGTFAIDAFAEATGEKKPKLLFDLEVGYRSTSIYFDSDTTGQSLRGLLLPPDGERKFQADGVAARGRVHLPIEAIRGTAFLEIGGAWNPDTGDWGDEIGGRTRIEGTRLETKGIASIAVGLRFGIPVGPVELGFRPFGGISWSFYDVEVRRIELEIRPSSLRGGPFGRRDFIWVDATGDEFRGDNSFAVSSGVVGGAFELRPAPKRLGVYVYAGGGYEMPFANTRETARATASLPGIRRDLEFEVFGSAEVRHTWFLETGIGWRFRAPF